MTGAGIFGLGLIVGGMVGVLVMAALIAGGRAESTRLKRRQR